MSPGSCCTLPCVNQKFNDLRNGYFPFRSKILIDLYQSTHHCCLGAWGSMKVLAYPRLLGVIKISFCYRPISVALWSSLSGLGFNGDSYVPKFRLHTSA